VRGSLPRAWLFVPGDSERKQTRALASGADALILDLEDSVAPGQRDTARARCAGLLGSSRAGPQLWVRVNPPGSDELAADLEALGAQALPHGVVLPKVSAPTELVALSDRLSGLEARRGQPQGAVRVLVIATETAAAVLNLPQYLPTLAAAPATLARLLGLTWGMEDLGAVLGASRRRAADGSLAPTFQLARSTCLLTAAALGVAAVDGVYTDYRDGAGLEQELRDSRADGFTGKLAIHPSQIGPIQDAFTPTDAECERARRVLAAFAAAGGAGVTSLEGEMLDRPHLLQAQRTLARAGKASP